MFPNMYGANAGSHNLAGKTNAQIASYFTQLFNVSGMKIDAQALAVSLAIYVTNTNLAGNVAAQYGFVRDLGRHRRGDLQHRMRGTGLQRGQQQHLVDPGDHAEHEQRDEEGRSLGSERQRFD